MGKYIIMIFLVLQPFSSYSVGDLMTLNSKVSQSESKLIELDKLIKKAMEDYVIQKLIPALLIPEYKLSNSVRLMNTFIKDRILLDESKDGKELRLKLASVMGSNSGYADKDILEYLALMIAVITGDIKAVKKLLEIQRPGTLNMEALIYVAKLNDHEKINNFLIKTNTIDSNTKKAMELDKLIKKAMEDYVIQRLVPAVLVSEHELSTSVRLMNDFLKDQILSDNKKSKELRTKVISNLGHVNYADKDILEYLALMIAVVREDTTAVKKLLKILRPNMVNKEILISLANLNRHKKLSSFLRKTKITDLCRNFFKKEGYSAGRPVPLHLFH